MDTDADFDETDAALERALGHGGIALFSDDVRDEVERLLAAGQAVEPAARTRLVLAARRGAKVASAPSRALERLLYEHRLAAKRPLDAVASAARLDPDLLRRVERGSEKLTTLGADGTAQWIAEVGIDGDVALSALGVSFEVRRQSAAYAAGAQGGEAADETAAAFIAAVKVALARARRE